MRLYSVLDRTAERFAPPFVAVNDGIALRYYKQAVVDKVDPQLVHEYGLYLLGEWNDSVGIESIEDHPVEINYQTTAMPRLVDLSEVR